MTHPTPSPPPGPIVVLGHSLAAAENREPFAGLVAAPNGSSESGGSDVSGDLPLVQIAPQCWISPGSRHRYTVNETHGLRTLKVTLAGNNSLFLYRGLGACLHQLRPSLIYVWEEPWSLAALQVMRIARSLSCPWLFFSAENRPKTLPAPFAALQRKVFASANGAIVPTEDIAANLRRSGFTGPIHTIPLWVAPRPPVTLSQSKRLVFVGRFIPLKRLDLLLRALALMPKTELKLIGDGPDEPALRDLAQSLDLGDRVRFVGHVPNNQLHEALDDCSLLVLLTDATVTQAEQFGKAVLDGVLSALPVAVNPTGHLAHWPREFSTVKPVDCQSPIHLAADLSALLQAPPKTEILLQAREKAQDRYGPKAAALRFAQAFDHTVKHMGAP
jgi:glycosyltransferase involved in cell wall biosynthesis